jgi:hypothetical protein
MVSLGWRNLLGSFILYVNRKVWGYILLEKSYEDSIQNLSKLFIFYLKSFKSLVDFE